MSRASITPTLSAKISSPLVVNDAAAVTVAVETERDIGAVDQHRVAHRVQHLHVFGVGIVSRECMIEIAIERHDFAADGLQDLRREGSRRAVSAGRDDFELSLELRAAG